VVGWYDSFIAPADGSTPERLAVITALLGVGAAGGVALWVGRRSARRGRREADLASDAHARHLALLSEHADDAVLLVDETGRIVRANDRVREYYGWTPAELAGTSVRDLRAAGELDKFDGHLARIRAEGRLRFETVHRRRDGSTLHVEVSARGFTADGRWFFQAICRDQTERLATLRTLAFQAELLQNLHDAVIALDAGHLIRSWNGAAEHIYGFSAAEVLGRHITEVLPSEYAGRTFDEFVESLARQGRLAFDVRRRHRSGAWVDVEASAVVLRGDGGAVTGYVSVNRDVTDRKRAEAALRESQDRLARILESSSEGVWIVDRAGKTEFVNARAAQMFGTTPEAAAGRPLLDFVTPEAAERVRGILAAALGGESVRREFVRPQGQADVWINVSWTPLRAADGRVTGAVGLYMDVSEHRRAREQLLQAQKMDAVGRLASGVAHDFNNLLVGILSCSDHLLEALPPGDPLRAEAREIRAAGDRAAQLVRQLLAFGRKVPAAPAPVEPGAVVAGIEAILRRVAGAPVTLTLALEPAPWRARIDPGELEQVVVNLVVNGRDAMPGGGTLNIATRNVDLQHAPAGAEALAPGRYAVLSVADTGTGMTPEVLARAFEPFFTTKPKGSGTGLGLATAYAIVQEAGGAIVLESAPGQGTTATIYLPACDPAAKAAPDAPRDGAGQCAGRLVLVVDDEVMVRRAVRRLLERRGFRVEEAGGAAEALRRVAEEPAIDAVLSDVVMPEVSGVELAARLAALRPALPVLLMSGCSDGAPRTDREIIPKPFDGDALAGRLEAALRAAAERSRA
jgi:two-component system, cell cycle sensor histidine kinase and response regulator CckA